MYYNDDYHYSCSKGPAEATLRVEIAMVLSGNSSVAQFDCDHGKGAWHRFMNGNGLKWYQGHMLATNTIYWDSNGTARFR